MRSEIDHGRELNPTAASLLGLLRDGPMTGWDLVATADARLGAFWSLTRSQVYRELADMARAGLVDEGEPGSRDRKPYTLTERGDARFAEWLESDPGAEHVRVPLLLTLAFARHLSAARLRTLLHEQRDVHARRLAEYEALDSTLAAAPDAEPGRRTTLRYGVHHERAVLAWLDELVADHP